MQSPVQLSFRGLPRSGAITAEIHSRVERLEHLFGPLVRCHVVVEVRQQQGRKGNLHGLSIEASLPRIDVVRSHDVEHDYAHENVYVAIRDTFNAVARELEDRIQRQRANERHPKLANSSVPFSK